MHKFLDQNQLTAQKTSFAMNGTIMTLFSPGFDFTQSVLLLPFCLFFKLWIESEFAISSVIDVYQLHAMD
jgi:hypothetical protein